MSGTSCSANSPSMLRNANLDLQLFALIILTIHVGDGVGGIRLFAMTCGAV